MRLEHDRRQEIRLQLESGVSSHEKPTEFYCVL